MPQKLTLCTQNSSNAIHENHYVENNFIDSLGPGRDSNPDPSALKPSECTTTPSTSQFDAVGLQMSFPNGDWIINDWTISEFWCIQISC